MVERTMIAPPTARLGVITPQERQAVIARSPVKGKYDTVVDRDSAFEILQQRTQDTAAPGGTAQGEQVQTGGGILGGIGGMIGDLFGTSRPRGQVLTPTQRVAREVTRSVTNRVIGGVAGSIGKSVGGSMGNTIARAIVRGTLGGILRR
jgi:hypothetical protein